MGLKNRYYTKYYKVKVRTAAEVCKYKKQPSPPLLKRWMFCKQTGLNSAFSDRPTHMYNTKEPGNNDSKWNHHPFLHLTIY